VAKEKESKSERQRRPTRLPDSLLPEWQKLEKADHDYIQDTIIIRTRRQSRFVRCVETLLERLKAAESDDPLLQELVAWVAEIRRIFPELVPWREIPELEAKHQRRLARQKESEGNSHE